MPKHNRSAAKKEPTTKGQVPSSEGGAPKAKTRLNLELPARVADQLSSVAQLTSRSKTDFLRLAIGTYAVLCDEARRGHKVVIQTSEGAPIKEVIIPL